MLTISGLGPILAGLAGAGARVAVGGGKAVEDAAEAVAEVMRDEAPVLTGALRDSIEVSRDGLSAEVGPTVRYAPFVEYGTAFMAPEPYAAPAAEAADRKLGDGLLNIDVF